MDVKEQQATISITMKASASSVSVDDTTGDPLSTTTTITSLSSSFLTNVVTFSAPGKILLVGGYLVLEETNVGLVIAVDQRFYCQCCCSRRRIDTTNTTNHAMNLTVDENSSSRTTTTTTFNNNNHPPTNTIRVVSPQFGMVWLYTWVQEDTTTKGTSSGKLTPVPTTTTKDTDDDVEEAVANKSSELQHGTIATSRNIFIEKALKVALMYYYTSTTTTTTTEDQNSWDITLTIAADNDFYSLVPHLEQRNMALDMGHQLPPRLKVARCSTTNTIYKTGLGSSACLVTAITAAVLAGLGKNVKTAATTCTSHNKDPQDQNNVITLDQLTRLAQIGHCYAQQKIGSGFDVSAACYGSHVYQRFPKNILTELLHLLELEETNSNLDETTKSTTTKTLSAAQCLQTIVDSPTSDPLWTGGVQDGINIFHKDHSFLQCLMADISGGSESPSMARMVLEWRKQQLDTNGACPHWDDLAQLNPQIIDLLQQIDRVILTTTNNIDDITNDHEQTTTTTTVSALQEQFRTEMDWSRIDHPVAPLLVELRQALIQSRYHLKAMGEMAGVPIEPIEQTNLCNATQEIPGVVATLVPGAGGYDAVVCVYVNLPSVRESIAQFWSHWHNVGGMEVTQRVGTLTVQGASYGDGLRLESEFPTLSVDNST